MKVIHLLTVMACTVNWILAGMILKSNWRSQLNWAGALILFSIGLWNLTLFGMHQVDLTRSEAWIWSGIGILSWGSFAANFLWLTFCITHFLASRPAVRRLILAFAMAVVVLIIALHWSGYLFGVVFQPDLGWRVQWPATWGIHLYSFQYLLFFVVSLGLLWRHQLQTKSKRDRKQTLVIFYSALIALILSGVVDDLIPRLGLLWIPNIGGLLANVWSMGLGYTILRHNLIALSPEVATNQIVQKIPGALFLLDRNQRITFSNRRASELSNAMGGQLDQRPFRSLLVVNDDINRIYALLFSDQGCSDLEMELLALDYSRIPVLISSATIWDQSGERIGYVVLAFDNRARLQARSEQMELQKKLFLSAKLASIGELAAGVGHEINNPLLVIQGSAELLQALLKKEDGPVAERERFISISDRMMTACMRITSIVKGLRSFSRASGEEYKSVDVHAVLDETFLLLEEIYRKQGVELVRDYRAQQVLVHGSAGKIQQVILNLLSNARDSILEKKELTGHLRMEDWQIVVQTLNCEGQLYIKIIDRGMGIPKAVQTKIFETFFTTKEVGKGTGLGLSISRSLIKEMRGDLLFSTRPGDGTTFTLKFTPIAMAGQASTNPPLEFRPVQSQTSRSYHVLVVDDESVIRELICKYLQDLGHTVETALNGAQALELLTEHSYDVLITDLTMPIMDGEELLRTVIEHLAVHTHIVVMTGALDLIKDKDFFVRYRHRIAMLDKPFSVAGLTAAIEPLKEVA